MGKNKKEIDGETYIVSEEIDFNDIDLENMVDNSEHVTNVKISYSNDTNDTNDNEELVIDNPDSIEERIWLEVVIEFSSEEEKNYTGILETIHISKDITHFYLLLNREQACEIVNNFAKDTFAGNKIFLKKYKSFYLNQECVLHLEDKCIITNCSMQDLDHKDIFVKVNFSIIY